MKLFFSLLVGLFICEWLTQRYVKRLRKRFQWLITEADECPELDSVALSKFFISGYDPQLGWVRKPNTEHQERGKYGPTRYRIDSIGSRENTAHAHLPLCAVCYGDSFTFCRQVNDTETWPWYLSELMQGNVLNFGVGNYGLDQALLRFERECEKHRAPITIMGVVPSTIVRILSYWKHYNEYGNTFAFKPRFELNDGELVLLPNLIDSEQKYFTYQQYLPQIQAHDYFYQSKFRREMIRFPYLIHTLKNPIRNMPIMAALSLSGLLGGRASPALRDYPLERIMNINLTLRVGLFEEHYPRTLLVALVKRFRDRAISSNSLPVFLWLPQKDDLLFIRSHYNYYAHALEELSGKVGVIDLTEDLLNISDLDSLYSDDGVYGGHLSREGNALVASIIHERLEALRK